MFLGQGSKYNGKFRAADSKNLPNHVFLIKNQAKSLIFHCFPCQNFPTVKHSSRHAYRGFILVKHTFWVKVLYGKNNAQTICTPPKGLRRLQQSIQRRLESQATDSTTAEVVFYPSTSAG